MTILAIVGVIVAFTMMLICLVIEKHDKEREFRRWELEQEIERLEREQGDKHD